MSGNIKLYPVGPLAGLMIKHEWDLWLIEAVLQQMKRVPLPAPDDAASAVAMLQAQLSEKDMAIARSLLPPDVLAKYNAALLTAAGSGVAPLGRFSLYDPVAYPLLLARIHEAAGSGPAATSQPPAPAPGSPGRASRFFTRRYDETQPLFLTAQRARLLAADLVWLDDFLAYEQMLHPAPMEELKSSASSGDGKPTCAVVSSSSVMTGTGHGAEIDAHDVVLRYDDDIWNPKP